MKYAKTLFLTLVNMALLQACGGGDLLGDDNSVDMLSPEPPAIDYTTIDRPSESAAVITTDDRYIYDANNQQVQLRGVDLNYHISPDTHLAALDAIASTGANIVRLLVDQNTTATQLQAALDKVVENQLIAIVSYTEDTAATNCTGNFLNLDALLIDLWFGEWHSVLIQDKYQAHLMINFAKGFGPSNVFNANSLAYDNYIDVHKAIIGVFRNAGFKVPMVVEAPGCGADFNAFVAGRARRLLAADTENNIILSANANEASWNSSERTNNALANLAVEKMPFMMTGIAGSEVGASPQDYVDHLDIMAKAVGDQGVRIDLQWQSEDDSVSYVLPLPETTDLNGGAVSIDAFLDRPLLQYKPIEGSTNFAPVGTLTMALFIRDANGNELRVSNTEAKDIRAFVWNTLRANIPTADAIDPENLMQGLEFDPAAVTHLGLQIHANGKPVNINGDIQLDKLRLFPGVPPLVNLGFDDSIEGWEVPWGEGVTLSHDSGVLRAQPIGPEIVFAVSPATLQSIDFSKDLKISFDIYIPEGYPEGLWAKVYGQFNEWSVWTESPLAINSVVPGEWTTLTTSANWSASSDVSFPQRLGIQTGGYSGSEAEPMLIDNFIVEDLNARPTKTITALQYLESFSSNDPGAWAESPGWHGDGNASVAAIDEALIVSVPGTADEGRGGAINNAGISGVQEIDFGGPLEVSFDIFLPESLAGTDAVFKLFFQDASWENQLDFPNIYPDEIALGEWVSLEYRIEDDGYPEGFNRVLLPNRFGVDYIDVPGGTEFGLDNFTIIGNTVVDDLQPIFETEFSDAQDISAFAAEAAGGGQSLDSAEAAKSADWQIIPFGWTATTWFGAENDELGLDLSNSLDTLDPTDRGSEIIEGEHGIRASASDVSF